MSHQPPTSPEGTVLFQNLSDDELRELGWEGVIGNVAEMRELAWSGMDVQMERVANMLGALAENFGVPADVIVQIMLANGDLINSVDMYAKLEQQEKVMKDFFELIKKWRAEAETGTAENV